MLESFRHSIGMLTARFHFRSARAKVISFSQSIPSSDTLFVVMPFRSAVEQEELNLLTLFRSWFNEKNITVVTRDQKERIEQVLPRARVISLAPEELTPFFLPRRAVLERVRERQYDLAVDMNLDFMLPSAYICMESGARVRVGFSGPNADTFYNLQVRLDPSSHEGHAYKRLVNCLRIFFTKEGV
jgi:ADP-heptose:LPS heptosyltransferase